MNNLYRPITAKNVFQQYIPTSNCKPNYIGAGDTGFSLAKMADVAKNNVSQGKNISLVLQKNNLADTTASIHHFLYNNFQYKADESDQILRSLSCSWADRETGIDCKSYSIAASIILSNLGIFHSFRRVKQPGFLPNQYTHVYVIVPNNQKTLGLGDGYYVIDGTLPTMDEVKYLQKDDYPIAIGLSEPANFDLSWFDKIFSGDWGRLTNGWSEAFSAPGGIWKNLSCIGGSTFASSNLEQFVDEYIAYIISENKNLFQVIQTEIAKPVINNNRINEELLNVILNVASVPHTIQNFYEHKNWDSACTRHNLSVAVEFSLKNALGYINNLKAFLNEYFIFSPSPGINVDLRSRCAITGIPVNFTLCSSQAGTPLMATVETYNLSLKNNIAAIPVFEFTPAMIDAMNNGNSFGNIKDYINTLQNFLPLFGSTGGGTGGGTIDVSNPNLNVSDTSQSLFSSNWLIGGLLIGGLVYGLKTNDNKPKTLTK